ncbi:MAG: MotA/TolQ/ExbB proton channel family protein, partial [Pyrinomonadaceae bacterium]
MKRLDLAIPTGIILGLAAIGGAAYLEGIKLAFLWQPAALLVVAGGTIGAVVVRRGLLGSFVAMRAAASLLRHDDGAAEHELLIARLSWIARATRREGVQVLERQAEASSDLLVKRALTLAAEMAPPDEVAAQLERILEDEHEAGQRDAATIEACGGFAPTFGILGAVLGLIQVLRSLADPQALGSGIATAFVATIYGVGLANLVLFPVAARMRARHQTRMRQRGMLARALGALAAQETPSQIARHFQPAAGFSSAPN